MEWSRFLEDEHRFAGLQGGVGFLYAPEDSDSIIENGLDIQEFEFLGKEKVKFGRCNEGPARFIL